MLLSYLFELLSILLSASNIIFLLLMMCLLKFLLNLTGLFSSLRLSGNSFQDSDALQRNPILQVSSLGLLIVTNSWSSSSSFSASCAGTSSQITFHKVMIVFSSIISLADSQLLILISCSCLTLLPALCIHLASLFIIIWIL